MNSHGAWGIGHWAWGIGHGALGIGHSTRYQALPGNADRSALPRVAKGKRKKEVKRS
ncbi:hypothetical protein [Microcoleus sp. bin38.metabat.b11b12b14.051]|uniref:hypothetical protein n=1 Tax=Microcoleus sp. bin38.metabat.b11b12b14.051 TaxID=2742709 RepID=UPI0025FC2D3D|nr:hypothetical protein [Microcoleus sp. bin38.metabat.b11b12b14.051]